MRLRAAAPVLALLVFSSSLGCRRQESEPGVQLVSQVKAALAERERKIQSFRFDSVVEQGDQKVDCTFSFRAPNKMRGDLGGTMTLAYDGKRFVQFDTANGYYSEIDLAAEPREKAQLFLHRVFSPLAPDGWRAPLLSGKVTGTRQEQDGKPRIALTTEATSDGQTVAMTYLLAPPAMDLVGRSVRGGGSVEVLEQHCDAGLKLCFPSLIVDLPVAGPKATTRLSGIQINVAIPPEYFRPEAPEGVEVVKRSLP